MINYDQNRRFVENIMKNHNMSLCEAIVEFLDTHEIPHDKLRKYFDQGIIDKIKASLTPLRSNNVHVVENKKPRFIGFLKL